MATVPSLGIAESIMFCSTFNDTKRKLTDLLEPAPAYRHEVRAQHFTSISLIINEQVLARPSFYSALGLPMSKLILSTSVNNLSKKPT